MTRKFSLIGPNEYLDTTGRIYKKASATNSFVRVTNKYTEAEDRFVTSHLQKKGRNENDQAYD